MKNFKLIPPKYYISNRLVISQQLEEVQKPSCLQHGPVKVRHTLTVANHNIDVVGNVTVSVTMGPGSAGICKECWVSHCQCAPTQASYQQSMRPTYWREQLSVVTLMCWSPNLAYPELNVHMQVDVAIQPICSTGPQSTSNRAYFTIRGETQ